MNWYLLSEIGGWHVGCINESHNWPFVAHVLAAGLVTKRWHYAPMIPEGVEAYELTDKGIACVRARLGDAAASNAERQRAWYREHTSIAGW